MKERVAAVKNPDTRNDLSKRAKARLLMVNLSTCYIKPKPLASDQVAVMNEIREIYAAHPFKGYRRITWDLQDMGYKINHKRVYRLMKLMGLQALYPKINLSKRRQSDAVYPYLLKNSPPNAPHDVWCVDITYIRTATGFIYLTGLIDVVSRYMVGYNVSTCLDTESCILALEMAIKTGYKPLIINSDQGCQFTSQEWAYNLSLLEIKISMDGKGRALDNIPIERFWRSIKYEEVYLKTYESVSEAKKAIANYVHWYNHHRRHSGIDGALPVEVMTGVRKAAKWAFMQEQEQKQGQEQRVDGYVDNCEEQLPHRSTTPTTTTTNAIKIIRQQKVKQTANHSSENAA